MFVNVEDEPLAFQSTPSVWRETDGLSISHGSFGHFNPLPPCGGRHIYDTIYCNNVLFQSTPSVWRETDVRPPRPYEYGISIHSLRVEGDLLSTSRSKTSKISIHSLRVEGDKFLNIHFLNGKNFNPLPPCGGRHENEVALSNAIRISIHSLRVEGDLALP